MYDYNNPPYGTPAYFEKMERLKNAHKSPDPILAQQQIQATQDAYAAANPPSPVLQTRGAPSYAAGQPDRSAAPGGANRWQQFKNGAAGILSQMTSGGEGPSQYISEQYGQQSPVGAATQEFNMTSPENLQSGGPERYVPAPVVDSVGQGPMTDQERAAFAQTPAGQRLLAAQAVTGDPEAQTGGRRDSTTLAAAKKNSGMSFAEKMGRYGGAIMNAGSQGGMAQVGAMGTVTGEIKDIEREQENLRLQEQQKVQEAQQKKSAEFDGIISEYDTAIAQMDTLYGDVAAGGGSLTGPISGTLGAWWDTLQGNPEAYTRLAMDQFKVDEILKNVAKTKGAISERERATVERPMPSMMAEEKVWLDWIYEKRAAAVSVRNKLRAMQGGGGPSHYSPKDQALIDQYSQ